MFYDLWKLGVAYVAVLTFVFFRIDDPAFVGWAIFFLTLIGIATLIFAVAWFHQSRSIDGWVQLQGEEPVLYTLSGDEVSTSARTGSTKFTWEAFSELAISDFDTLLKFPGRGGALTLATNQVPVEALDFLKERFRVHGKKIDDKRRME